jgi:hypothetical protein
VVSYIKNQPVGDFKLWADDEFTRVERALNEPDVTLRLQKLNAEPTRLLDGMIAYADGTNWDPGSGAGVYYYNGSAWVQLG